MSLDPRTRTASYHDGEPCRHVMPLYGKVYFLEEVFIQP